MKIIPTREGSLIFGELVERLKDSWTCKSNYLGIHQVDNVVVQKGKSMKLYIVVVSSDLSR